MTAVLASRLNPETILVLKGNKALELCTQRKHRAVLYASDPRRTHHLPRPHQQSPAH
jgi:hypothetical protein